MSNLLEVQNWLRWAITDPRGIDDAFAETDGGNAPPGPRYQMPAPDVRALIRAVDPEDLKRRLSVYAEAYFARLANSLANDFPVTRKHLGEERFLKLVADYLKDFPSRYSNIGEVGRDLPRFIRRYSVATKLPWVGDLVEVEWLMIEGFYQPKGPRFDSIAFATAIEETDWKLLRFRLDPALAILSSQWRITDLFAGDFDHDEAPAREPCDVLIYRDDGFCRLKTIDAHEAATLRRLRDGASFEEVIDLLQTFIRNESDLQKALQAWFGEWTSLELIHGVVK